MLAWVVRLLMVAKPHNLTIKKDRTREVLAGLTVLATHRVMAGIPAANAARKDVEGEKSPLNNAEIMKINEDGAPEANIPARPVVHPAIASIRPQIAKGLGKTATTGLDGKGSAAVMKGFAAVGQLAQNAMQARITDGPFAPLSPKTIAQRAAQRGSTKRRKGETQYLNDVAAGVSPAEAQAAANIKPLINTGQLRRALTWVIRKILWRR